MSEQIETVRIIVIGDLSPEQLDGSGIAAATKGIKRLEPGAQVHPGDIDVASYDKVIIRFDDTIVAAHTTCALVERLANNMGTKVDRRTVRNGHWASRHAVAQDQT